MRTRPRVLLSLLLISLLPLVVRAQQHPNQERGFAADKVYTFGGLDNINLFNGNLTLTIPLGQRYNGNGSLAYAFALVYSGNVWDYSLSNSFPSITQAIPNRRSNAGVGWLFSLGRLVPPSDPTNETYSENPPPSSPGCVSGYQVWLYETSDGNDHVFYPTLTPGGTYDEVHCYTRDSTYIRMTVVDTVTRNVELPDGTVQVFNELDAVDGAWPITSSPGAGTWRLTSVRDRFGNQLQISYSTIGSYKEIWTFSEGSRTHTAYFIEALSPYRVILDHVDLAAFGGTTATYTFGYRYAFVDRGFGDNSGTSGQPGPAWFVPLLTSITLPVANGSVGQYQFLLNGSADYDLTGATTGHLRGVQLPTRGWIEWDYERFIFPSPTDAIRRTRAVGVIRRRLLDASRVAVGSWTYSRQLSARRTCFVNGTPFDSGSPQLVTGVGQPNGRTDVHYFSVYADPVDGEMCPNPEEWRQAEYGLSLTRGVADDTGSRFLSNESRNGIVSLSTGPGQYRVTGGTRLRSNYTRFELETGSGYTSRSEFDTNKRVTTERTNFEDDQGCSGACYATVDYFGFDGLGHFKQASHGGNFTGGAYRTRFTNYDTSLDAAGDWILGTYSEQCTVDESSRRWTAIANCAELINPAAAKFSFERSTGFLTARRTLAGTALASNDLLARFEHDASGNLTSEAYYGGDRSDQALGTDTQAPFTPPTTPNYSREHSFTYHLGTIIKRRTQYSGTTFYSADEDFDVSTGLVSASRDVSGLQTDYAYDARGRLSSVKPQVPTGGLQRDAWRIFAYNDAAPTLNARVAVQHFLNGSTSGAALAERSYEYDALGRLIRERRTTASGAIATKSTSYNVLGWVTRSSDFESIDPPQHGTSYGYDYLGNVTSIEAADGSLTSIALAGSRVSTRTSRIALATGESDVSTTELRDSLGRLVSVTEASNFPEAQTTAYQYDVADRLTTATVQTNPVQTRTFAYDNRGFLKSEQHPELGANGNGTTTYKEYDARGHILRKYSGGEGGSFDLTFEYDTAERLRTVSDLDPVSRARRVLKQFTFATSNATGEANNGKLATATRHHFSADFADIPVTETYHYAGREGRISSRETVVGSTAGFTGMSFSYAQSWNDLGDVETLTYPTTTVVSTTGRTVTYGYTNGWLTSVSPYTSAGPAIGYDANGMVTAVAHANGTTEYTYVNPDTAMARPDAIQMIGTGGVQFWGTGTYAYDGSGNIKQIGNPPVAYTDYVYDAFGRLTSSKTIDGDGSTRSASQGYDAYGNWLYNAVRFCGPPNGTNIGPCGGSSVLPAEMSGTTNHYVGLEYDEAGNVTSYGPRTFGYDAVSMLTRASVNGRSFLHLYTADDERIAAVERVTGGDGVTRNRSTYTLRDTSNRLLRMWVDDWTSGSRTTTWREDEIWRGNALLASESAAGTKHYALDHLGSPRFVTDGSGYPLGAIAFTPFGIGGATGAGALQFTGQERDAANFGGGMWGLPDYFHARFYDADRGRFLSVDSVGGNPHRTQSWNRYTYVENKPMNATDPTGEATVVVPVYQMSGQDRLRFEMEVAQAREKMAEIQARAKAGDPLASSMQTGEAEAGGLGPLDIFVFGWSLRAAQASTPFLRFASKELLEDHFARHGSKLGVESAAEYLTAARKFFMGAAEDKSVMQYTRAADGARIFFNPATREAGVLHEGNIIGTYLRTRNVNWFINKFNEELQWILKAMGQ